MFVDIDDYIENNSIRMMYDYAVLNNCDYVYADYYEHYEGNDKVIRNFRCSDLKKNAVLANTAPWGKLISKELMERISFKFCEGKIYEDVAIMPYLACCAMRVGYISVPVYYYNMTNLSTTRDNKYKEKFEDIIFVSDYLYNLLKKENLVDLYYEELQFIYLDSILQSIGKA